MSEIHRLHGSHSRWPVVCRALERVVLLAEYVRPYALQKFVLRYRSIIRYNGSNLTSGVGDGDRLVIKYRSTSRFVVVRFPSED